MNETVLSASRMPPSDEENLARRAATREVATALMDDFNYMRRIIANAEPAPDDIRRISNILRRLLIDYGGDIHKVSPPRFGRLSLLGPDLNGVYRATRGTQYEFISAGECHVYGFAIDLLCIGPPMADGVYSPGVEIPLSVDGFLGQKVLCFEGQWISRRDCIKYVANVASGVHSGSPNGSAQELIDRVRRTQIIRRHGENIQIASRASLPERLVDIQMPFERNCFDIALLQIASSARYVTISPDMQALVRLIEQE